MAQQFLYFLFLRCKTNNQVNCVKVCHVMYIGKDEATWIKNSVKESLQETMHISLVCKSTTFKFVWYIRIHLPSLPSKNKKAYQPKTFLS